MKDDSSSQDSQENNEDILSPVTMLQFSAGKRTPRGNFMKVRTQKYTGEN
jgi:hypothetical protein